MDEGLDCVKGWTVLFVKVYMQGGSYREGRGGGGCAPNNLENYGGKKPVDQLIT